MQPQTERETHTHLLAHISLQILYTGSKHQKGEKTKTASLMAIKSHLSDLWRVVHQVARWTWSDAERTCGFGNATQSQECMAVKSQSRRYDAHHGN
eukprot:6180378-Pleurochrysis_carterae.AAC.2